MQGISQFKWAEWKGCISLKQETGYVIVLTIHVSDIFLRARLICFRLIALYTLDCVRLTKRLSTITAFLFIK